MISRLYAEFR